MSKVNEALQKGTLRRKFTISFTTKQFKVLLTNKFSFFRCSRDKDRRDRDKDKVNSSLSKEKDGKEKPVEVKEEKQNNTESNSPPQH